MSTRYYWELYGETDETEHDLRKQVPLSTEDFIGTQDEAYREAERLADDSRHLIVKLIAYRKGVARDA